MQETSKLVQAFVDSPSERSSDTTLRCSKATNAIKYSQVSHHKSGQTWRFLQDKLSLNPPNAVTL